MARLNYNDFYFKRITHLAQMPVYGPGSLDRVPAQSQDLLDKQKCESNIVSL